MSEVIAIQTREAFLLFYYFIIKSRAYICMHVTTFNQYGRDPGPAFQSVFLTKIYIHVYQHYCKRVYLNA